MAVIIDKVEKLGARYNNSLQNCMHASFLLASELLVLGQNILLCAFQYGKKQHIVVLKNKLYFDLWVGAIITTDYKIHHKFSFFDSNKFNRFYVTNKPKSINMINIGYVQNGNYK